MSKVPFFKAAEIAPRTWQIEYAFTDRENVYCYLTEGRDYALAIDTMMGHGDLRAFLETLTDRPVRLVNTHFHFDHCGGNFGFDRCYIHPRDIPFFYSERPRTAAEMLARARELAFPEYAEALEEGDFLPERPMRTLPVWDGDVFDLGDRQIEVIDVGGHTPGSIVLLDRVQRIAYTGDACNGNTLLGFDCSLPIEEYLGNLLHFKRFQGEFDVMYGGHQVLPPETLDEGIELCARILAGLDDRELRPGMFGRTATYGARHAGTGMERADGKNFNISYDPEKLFSGGGTKQVIGGKAD